MTAWEFLGIEPTQDERVIKRAYSKLLLVHRPDGDQAAFERLRQAYEAALHSARNKSNPGTARRVVFSDRNITLAMPPRPAPPSQVTAPADATSPLAAESQPGDAAEPLRSIDEVADELASASARLRDDPAAFQALLASVPELFNLDAKLAVSAALAYRISQGSSFPPKLVNTLTAFFEWDTFAEQRRLAMMGVQVVRLRELLGSEELQRYLSAVPVKGRDRDGVRRRLKLLRWFDRAVAYWALATLNLFWQKTLPAALNQAIGQFGHQAIETYLGKRCLKFWTRFYSPTPTLVQGSVFALRVLVGCLFTSLLSVIANRTNDGMTVGVTVVAGFLTAMLAWVFVAWCLKGITFWINHSMKAAMQTLSRNTIGRLFPNLSFPKVRKTAAFLRQPKVLLGVSILFGVVALLWPHGLSAMYLMLLVMPFMILTWPGYRTVVGLFLVTMGWITVMAPVTAKDGGRAMSLGWPLICFYTQWGCVWLARWRLQRFQKMKPNALQMMSITAAALIVLSVAISLLRS